jgi:hypothetical protein
MPWRFRSTHPEGGRLEGIRLGYLVYAKHCRAR